MSNLLSWNPSVLALHFPVFKKTGEKFSLLASNEMIMGAFK